ncbi:hypothetical protein E5288_WYG011244 [Bos mutus]|uniref:Uncharacterized protein n=1 Tax=Bos mutus TaxID=72004 RepID=A0A6B0R983_9CETA|nr:hypothetical protein [Bos mutus]
MNSSLPKKNHDMVKLLPPQISHDKLTFILLHTLQVNFRAIRSVQDWVSVNRHHEECTNKPLLQEKKSLENANFVLKTPFRAKLNLSEKPRKLSFPRNEPQWEPGKGALQRFQEPVTLILGVKMGAAVSQISLKSVSFNRVTSPL